MIAFHVNYTKFYIRLHACTILVYLSWEFIFYKFLYTQIVYFLILSFICLYIDQILQIEISYVCYLLKSMEIVKNVDNSNI